MAERDRARRLDQPIAPRRMVPRPQYDPEAFGRFAERFARFMGTSKFLLYMTVVVIAWVGYNAFVGLQYYQSHRGCSVNSSAPHCHGLKPFDPYPFILLNLFFSTQASYAAPLILLAQNRQADRDRVQIEEDRARNERNIADTEYLTREVASLRIALGDVATRDFIRSELQRLTDEIANRQEESSRHDGRPDERDAQPADVD